MTAAMMLAAQNSPLTGAMFCDARLGTSIYGGLFNPLTCCRLPDTLGPYMVLCVELE